MEVLEDQNQRALLTALYSELMQSFERLTFDRFGIRQCQRAGDILDFQQMEQDGPVLVRINFDLAKACADLLGDDIGGIGLENPAVAAQEVEYQRVGDRSTIGKAPSFDPGHPPIGDMPAELGKEP